MIGLKGMILQMTPVFFIIGSELLSKLGLHRGSAHRALHLWSPNDARFLKEKKILCSLSDILLLVDTVLIPVIQLTESAKKQELSVNLGAV